jgi:hypothetical protein
MVKEVREEIQRAQEKVDTLTEEKLKKQRNTQML